MGDLLISGGLVVTMDDQLGDLPGDVLVSGGKITRIAPSIEPPPGAQVIDASGMIVMPGFVNAHMHTWQTALRGLAADWTLAEYMKGMHAGLATFFRPDDIHIANLCGALNQMYCGTTTLVDWCHNNPTPGHTDAAVEGLEQSGIRALFLHGSPKPDAKAGQKHFSELPMPRGEVERLRKGRLASDDRRVTLGLAILGPGFGVWDVCNADFRLAKEMGLVASMHVSGPMLTADGFERLETLGLLGPHLNIVHGNSLDDAKLDLMTARGMSFTVTPEVEMQMSFGKPLTGRLRKRGAGVSLGSDVESDISSDMFTVMRMALQSQRFVDTLEMIEREGKGPQAITITCREALRWATIDGARMAGLDHRAGSLTPGKSADIIMLRTTDPNMFPVVDPVASIVLQASHGNVDTVIVDGEIRKRYGRLTYEGYDGLMGKLIASGQRIIGTFRERQSAAH